MDLIATLALAASEGPFNDGGDFWFLWPLVPIFWIVVVALVLRFVVFRGGRHREPSPMERARGILAERYARGEIDAEEYRRRSEELAS